MATKTLTVLCNVIICYISSVHSYYCNSDECAENEYCCGDGICCVSYTVWELWYFWLGIVVFLIMLSTCLCLWKSGFRERILYTKSHSPSYSPLPQKHNQAVNNFSDEFHISPDRNHQDLHLAPPAYGMVVTDYKVPH